jgi:parallel beta-helix repeat protein
LDDSTAVISHNIISGAGSSGIDVLASEIPFVEVTIVNNVISDPDWHGISLGNVYRSVVADNQVLNGVYGIQFFSSESGDLHRNTIHGSDTGIHMFGVDGAHVYRNTVRGCGTAGLYLEHSDFNHIEANVLTGNGNGLHFDANADDNLYRGNTARGNTVSDFIDSGTANTSHRDNYMPTQI